MPRNRKFGKDIRASLSVAQCVKEGRRGRISSICMDVGLDKAELVQPDVLGYAQHWKRTDSQPYSSSQNNADGMGNTISPPEIFGRERRLSICRKESRREGVSQFAQGRRKLWFVPPDTWSSTPIPNRIWCLAQFVTARMMRAAQRLGILPQD